MDLRQEIDRLMAEGEPAAAARLLTELWRSESTSAVAGFVVSRYEKLRADLPLVPCRVAILRSFTVEPVAPLLRAGAFTSGIDTTLHLGDFNAYAQEILDADSSLYRFAPDVVILAVLASDVAPEQVLDQFGGLVRAFRERSRAHLIIHTLEAPAFPSLGLMDGAVTQEINLGLRRLAAEHRGVYVLDYDALVARHGRLAWRDERKWLTMRMPIAAGHLGHLAQEWLRFLHPLTGKIAKALVVDLDNTLWGGVIGEDGMAGIKLGSEYPGAFYQALQRAMLDLYERGILLAVCSKNNPEDAMEALRNHPGMLLQPRHFAAMRINWDDKAQNLRDIAAELNVGIDALAFLDDNPVERLQVREQLPEMTVIELPSEPMGYARALRECPVFERLTLSDEDRQRGEMYALQRQRVELEQRSSSKEDFYRSLEQEAEIAAVTPMTVSRIAQLTQKTNQFNLTTRRYTEQQIAEMAACPGWQVLSIRVRDRYADNGLVGVAITHDDGDICELDSFLLSCRVIGRTVETALLSHVAAQARARGMRRLQGWFLPTRKNAPAGDFYRTHGFSPVSTDGAGSLWELNLSESDVARPEWIALVAA